MADKLNKFGLAIKDHAIQKCRETTKINERLKQSLEAKGTQILEVNWKNKNDIQGTSAHSDGCTEFRRTIMNTLKELDAKMDRILDNQEKILSAHLNKEMVHDQPLYKSMEEVEPLEFTPDYAYPIFDKIMPNISIYNAKESLSSMFDTNIPIATIEEFEDFDEKLKDDVTLSTNISTVMTELIDKNQVLTKSIVSMLKTFITKEVAMMYTAKKVVSGKKVFRNTVFYNIMSNILINQRSLHNIDTEEKDVIKALGDVLSNSTNWYNVKSKNRNSDTYVKEERMMY